VIVTALELSKPRREEPLAGTIALVVAVPLASAVAVQLGARFGLGSMGQFASATVAGILALIGLSLLLVSIFPGSFFI
jgi:uncharacterized membrane protein